MRALPIAAVLLFVSAPALAAPSAGEVLFREGRSAMQDKDYERACAKFAESQRVEPAPGTSLNLGDCEEQRGHFLAASEAFRAAAKAYANAEKRTYAGQRADAAEGKISRFTLRASAAPEGLVVYEGETPVALGVEQKRDPGALVLKASAPKRKPKQIVETLLEGKSVTLDVGALEDEAPPPAPPKVAPPETRVDLRTVGIIVGGVGAASLVAGTVTGILALGHASTVKDHCDDALACDAQGVEAARSGSTLSSLSTITFAAGAAGVIGGAVLYWLGYRRATTTAYVMPAVTPTGAGLQFGRAF